MFCCPSSHPHLRSRFSGRPFFAPDGHERAVVRRAVIPDMAQLVVDKEAGGLPA